MRLTKSKVGLKVTEMVSMPKIHMPSCLACCPFYFAVDLKKLAFSFTDLIVAVMEFIFFDFI